MPETKKTPKTSDTPDQDTINALAQLLSGGAQTRTGEQMLDIPGTAFVGLTPEQISSAFRSSMMQEKMAQEPMSQMLLNLQRISATKLSQARTKALGAPAKTPTVDIPGVGETTLTPAAAVSYYNALNPKEQDLERRRFDAEKKADKLPKGIETFPQWLEWRARSAATRITIGERKEIEEMKVDVKDEAYLAGPKLRPELEKRIGKTKLFGLSSVEKEATVWNEMDLLMREAGKSWSRERVAWVNPDGSVFRRWEK